MKIILAIIIGLGLAGFLASNLSEEQRAKVGGAAGKAAGSVKDSKLVSIVKEKSSSAADEVDDAADAAADAVDSAADTAADTVSDAAEAVADAK